MTPEILKKIVIILGIFLFLLGLFMIFAHVKSGFELFVAGIVILPGGIFMPVQASKSALNKKNAKRINSYPNIIQSFGITGMVILCTLIVSPVKIMLEKFIGKEASMLVGYILSVGIVLSVIYNVRRSKTKANSFNLSIGNKRIIPFLFITSIALLIGIAGPISRLIPVPESMKESILQIAGQTGFWTFILMVISAPVLEELIFRGIMLEGLLKKYTPATSIIISSVLFGIAHLNPWQLVSGLIIGIFSGWVYYKTRSLVPSVIIHAAANLSGFTMRYFIEPDSSINQGLLENYGGLRNLVLLIIGSAIIILVSIYHLSIEFHKQKSKNGSMQQIV